MRTRSKLLLAGITAALLLAVAVAGASANRLRLSNQSFRVTWTSLEFSNVNVETVRCPITMEGTFHSATISKVVGALVGYVTRATVNTGACTGGTASVNAEALPWHIKYAGFSGTLPRISGISLNLIGAKFTIRSSGLTCTSTTTAEHPALGIAQVNTLTGVISGMKAEERTGIPLRGGFLCEIGGEGFFAGTGTVTLLGATTAITVTLI